MLFWHGSRNLFGEFLTPNESGIIRTCEKDRSRNLDVTFVTPRLDIAMGYAENGYIYELDIPEDEISCLAESKQRKNRRKATSHSYNGDVFTTQPANITIVAVWQVVKKRRGDIRLVEKEITT